nr:hypothetical protein GCM10020093_047050 [Planobispora longispora]
MHVDGLVVAVGLLPHLGEQFLAGDHPVGPRGQVRQQVELPARQRERCAAHGGLTPVQVHRELAHVQHLRRTRAPRPPEHRVQPGVQVVAGERLDQVVVRPRLQQTDDLRLVVPGRRHDDRDVRDTADHLQRLRPVQIGQAEIEDHRIRRILGDLP